MIKSINKMKKYVAIIVAIILTVSCSCFAFADSPDDSGDSEGYSTSDSGTSVNYEVLRISASDTSGLHSIMLSLIGDYNPIVKDYTYTTTSYNGSVTTNHSIDIQPDWSWIMTCALFIIVIYSVFRLFGLALGGIK